MVAVRWPRCCEAHRKERSFSKGSIRRSQNDPIRFDASANRKTTPKQRGASHVFQNLIWRSEASQARWHLRYEEPPIADLIRFAYQKRQSLLWRSATPRPVWAFMHVPKTSGAAITEGLIRALTNPFGRRLTKAIYGRPQILTGFDRSLHGGFNRFDTFDASVGARLHLEDLPTGARVISGHFAYSTLRRSVPTARIFTILREPLCRLLSHWIYWRQYTEEELLPYGLWADRVREARRPLAEFLCSPTVACQTDNIVVRMLLWPHRLIPADGFINSAQDGELIAEACMRLAEMFHVDAVENPNLIEVFEGLIGRSIEYRRLNETRATAHEFRSDLDDHLTSEARELLALRLRLDLHLWNDVITRVLPGTSAHVVRENAINAGIARYQKLLKGRHAA